MKSYPFRLINYEEEGQLQDPSVLEKRSLQGIGLTFEEDARRFIPGEELELAMNTAIAVSEPLLITGEPGTGKTQAAYYAAYKLNSEPVIHFQVKSDSTAKDLLYHFDTVRYFHDAHFAQDRDKLDKKKYVEPRALWEALESDRTRVLLIDEIDKAPRDFPNDLLLELDKMEFTVIETGQKVPETEEKTKKERIKRPIVFITSNSERRLPEPFLRRCVYHHIPFDKGVVERAVEKRKDEYPTLSDEFREMAVDRFLALRGAGLRKKPSTAELLVWLRVLGLNVDQYSQRLDENLARLPYLGVLLKDHQDIEDLKGRKHVY